jgi:hypothetical protein
MIGESMQRRILIFALTALFCGSSHAFLGLGGRGSGDGESGSMVRREHLKVRDKDEEAELLRLMRARRIVEEDVRVIQRLLREKELQQDRAESNLLREFDVEPEHVYWYETAAKTLHRLSPVETNAAPAEGKAEERILHTDVPEGFEIDSSYQFHDDQEVQRFAGLAAARQLTAQQQTLLRLLLREKIMTLSAVVKDLQEKFSMSRDRTYEYDVEERMLYEIQPRAARGRMTEDE